MPQVQVIIWLVSICWIICWQIFWNYFRYGAVKFGLVLGGISAGLQSQSVSRRNLMLVAKANSIRGRQFRLPRLYSNDTSNMNISNIWAASLSGLFFSRSNYYLLTKARILFCYNKLVLVQIVFLCWDNDRTIL